MHPKWKMELEGLAKVAAGEVAGAMEFAAVAGVWAAAALLGALMLALGLVGVAAGAGFWALGALHASGVLSEEAKAALIWLAASSAALGGWEAAAMIKRGKRGWRAGLRKAVEGSGRMPELFGRLSLESSRRGKAKVWLSKGIWIAGAELAELYGAAWMAVFLAAEEGAESLALALVWRARGRRG